MENDELLPRSVFELSIGALSPTAHFINPRRVQLLLQAVSSPLIYLSHARKERKLAAQEKKKKKI